jgi:hypothetical protein
MVLSVLRKVTNVPQLRNRLIMPTALTLNRTPKMPTRQNKENRKYVRLASVYLERLGILGKFARHVITMVSAIIREYFSSKLPVGNEHSGSVPFGARPLPMSTVI